MQWILKQHGSSRRDSHARCVSLAPATATLICLTPAVGHGSGDIKRDKGKWKWTIARNGRAGKRRPVTAAKLQYRSLTLHYTVANKCFEHVDISPINNNILTHINVATFAFWFYASHSLLLSEEILSL